MAIKGHILAISRTVGLHDKPSNVTLREAELWVTLQDKKWEVRKVVGVRRTESEGIARVPTATGGDADLGSGLGSGPTPGTGAMDVDDDSPSGPVATGEERTQEDISASNVSNVSNISPFS